MALEAAGLALGAAGLAGIFSACLRCLELVDLAKEQTRDLTILHTKLENQKALFVAWAQSVGFGGQDDGDKLLCNLSPLLRNRVAATMQQIGLLFWDAERLRKRYGLGTYGTTECEGRNSVRTTAFRVMIANWQSGSVVLRVTASSNRHVVRWVVKDRHAFLELIQDFRDLVEDLELLTITRKAVQARAHIISDAMSDLGDEDLAMIQCAGVGQYVDEVASIASEVLQVRSRCSSLSNRSRCTSYYSARSCLSLRLQEPDQGEQSPIHADSTAQSTRTAFYQEQVFLGVLETKQQALQRRAFRSSLAWLPSIHPQLPNGLHTLEKSAATRVQSDARGILRGQYYQYMAFARRMSGPKIAGWPFKASRPYRVIPSRHPLDQGAYSDRLCDMYWMKDHGFDILLTALGSNVYDEMGMEGATLQVYISTYAGGEGDCGEQVFESAPPANGTVKPVQAYTAESAASLGLLTSASEVWGKVLPRDGRLGRLAKTFTLRMCPACTAHFRFALNRKKGLKSCSAVHADTSMVVRQTGNYRVHLLDSRC